MKPPPMTIGDRLENQDDRMTGGREKGSGLSQSQPCGDGGRPTPTEAEPAGQLVFSAEQKRRALELIDPCMELEEVDALRAAYRSRQKPDRAEPEPSEAMIDAAERVLFGEDYVPVFPSLSEYRRAEIARMYRAMREARS